MGLSDNDDIAFFEEGEHCYGCDAVMTLEECEKEGNTPIIMEVVCEAEGSALLPEHTHPRIYHEKCIPEEVREQVEAIRRDIQRRNAARWN